MELNPLEKSIVAAMVQDLQSDPALVGRIESRAMAQGNSFDFADAILSTVRAEGLAAFPRFEAILEAHPKTAGMGAFELGEALFSLFEVGLEAGAGYLGAKLLTDAQEDMLKDKLGFEERMANRGFDLQERNIAAMEEYNRLIQGAKDRRPPPSSTYEGSGRGGTGYAGKEDGLPSWVTPVAIGAGALAVGYVAFK